MGDARRYVHNTAADARRLYAIWRVTWLPPSGLFGVRVEATVYALTPAAAIEQARRVNRSARFGVDHQATLERANPRR
ncbi:MAG: hypothetical protein KF768_13460 [Phycisphaeraceae bacterium]|nr:hypothetical protein [Phycisphaeraceae bacterium]